VNLGAQLAQKALKSHGAKAVVARELKIRPDRVSRIVGGDRLPNPAERAYFEDKHGIGWRAWDAPPAADDAAGTGGKAA
jgi:hypothetical protein